MTTKPIAAVLGWFVLGACLVGCLFVVGCTVTGGVVGPDGAFVQGVKLEVTADPDVKQAAFDYIDSMGTRYRFAQACLEEHEPDDCRDVMGFIESFRDVPEDGGAEPE